MEAFTSKQRVQQSRYNAERLLSLHTSRRRYSFFANICIHRSLRCQRKDVSPQSTRSPLPRQLHCKHTLNPCRLAERNPVQNRRYLIYIRPESVASPVTLAAKLRSRAGLVEPGQGVERPLVPSKLQRSSQRFPAKRASLKQFPRRFAAPFAGAFNRAKP